MSEWISVKEQFPSSKIFVEVKRKVLDRLKKVSLSKTKDDCMREGFIYQWKYKSGIFAGSLDEEDEWKIFEESSTC